MSLKAKIRNLSREKNISAQVLLQNYMFERFLERLSKSNFKNNFILKGGVLVAAIIGVANRSTMDMDVTLKNFELTEESLSKSFIEICNIEINDEIKFVFTGIKSIRDENQYGGFRVSIKAIFDRIVTPLSIDITTGDIITPHEVILHYKMIFSEETLDILAYNIETVLAEKVETILNRGELNTRPRDFYDIFILGTTQSIDKSIFRTALDKTVEYRDTNHIFDNIQRRVRIIEESELLKNRWIQYSRSYPYAEKISYEDTINALKNLIN